MGDVRGLVLLAAQVATESPADRILVETDAPFLAPIPLRGQQNQPANVTHTAAFLAGLRGVTPQAIAQQTTANFRTLFPFPSSLFPAV